MLTNNLGCLLFKGTSPFIFFHFMLFITQLEILLFLIFYILQCFVPNNYVPSTKKSSQGNQEEFLSGSDIPHFCPSFPTCLSLPAPRWYFSLPFPLSEICFIKNDLYS